MLRPTTDSADCADIYFAQAQAVLGRTRLTFAEGETGEVDRFFARCLSTKSWMTHERSRSRSQSPRHGEIPRLARSSCWLRSSTNTYHEEALTKNGADLRLADEEYRARRRWSRLPTGDIPATSRELLRRPRALRPVQRLGPRRRANAGSAIASTFTAARTGEGAPRTARRAQPLRHSLDGVRHCRSLRANACTQQGRGRGGR